jgi:hypothetical protein
MDIVLLCKFGGRRLWADEKQAALFAPEYPVTSFAGNQLLGVTVAAITSCRLFFRLCLSHSINPQPCCTHAAVTQRFPA